MSHHWPRTCAGCRSTPVKRRAVLQELDAVQDAMAACSTSADAPVVAYVSKMVAVPASALPRTPGAQLHEPSGAQLPCRPSASL